MPLGELDEVAPTMLVIGKGRMPLLPDSMAACAGGEMNIERCDTIFQAGIKMSTKQFHVVLIEVAANGLQETVQSIRTLNHKIVVLAVRGVGATSVGEGIDESFPSDAAPELIVLRAIHLSPVDKSWVYEFLMRCSIRNSVKERESNAWQLLPSIELLPTLSCTRARRSLNCAGA